MRLDQLAATEGDSISIEWKSFLLRPMPEERTLEDFTEYTRSWARPAGMERRTTFTTPWSGDNPPPTHSVPSAIAGKVASQFGGEVADRYHRRLLEAYFTENRTISDRSVLLDVAAESGLDRDEFASSFDDQGSPLKREVFDDYNLAVNSGVTGVPAVVVDGRYLITGAVEADEYRAVLDKVRTSPA